MSVDTNKESFVLRGRDCYKNIRSVLERIDSVMSVLEKLLKKPFENHGKGEQNIMRIMTFNLRFENSRDGPFGWDYRRALVVEVIRRHAPDILGTQEGTRNQLEFLRGQLSREYEMVAVDRVWDETCQYPTFFCRKEDWVLLRGGEHWLSLTPHIHRSKNWDSAFPRMMSHAHFRQKSSSRELLAVVTHLDHIGARARLGQAEMIAEWLQGQHCPCVVLGDFNDMPESRVHSVLTGNHKVMTDTWQALSKGEGDESMTRHDFLGRPKSFRMDWILHSEELIVRDAAILRDNLDGFYPSDHYPYMADLEWNDVL